MRPTADTEATEFISGLFNKSVSMATCESQILSSSALGLSAPEKSGAPQQARVYDHYLIGGEPQKSKEAAWDEFWKDFDRKVVLRGEMDIYWRRNVEYVTQRNFDTCDTDHVVRARFSLGAE